MLGTTLTCNWDRDGVDEWTGTSDKAMVVHITGIVGREFGPHTVMKLEDTWGRDGKRDWIGPRDKLDLAEAGSRK